MTNLKWLGSVDVLSCLFLLRLLFRLIICETFDGITIYITISNIYLTNFWQVRPYVCLKDGFVKQRTGKQFYYDLNGISEMVRQNINTTGMSFSWPI